MGIQYLPALLKKKVRLAQRNDHIKLRIIRSPFLDSLFCILLILFAEFMIEN